MSASSRLRRRRLAESGPGVDRAIEADARFFERFRHRSHRVRLAAQAELVANAAALGIDKVETAPGRRWFCAVRQVEPGIRLRLFVENDADVDVEMTENEAATVFAWLAENGAGHAAEVEARLRAAVERRRRAP